MKKLLAIVLVTGLAASAWAGGSCCGSKKSADGAKCGSSSMSQCEDVFATLDLTSDQKAKIFDIQAACKKDESKDASCAKYMSQIRETLTPEQRVKFDAGMSKGDQEKVEETKPAS